MSTFALLKWAFDLRGLAPLDKLVAVYFAARAGSDGEVGHCTIAIHDLADWCCCTKEDADVALGGLQRRGLACQGMGPWLYRCSLNLPSEPRSAATASPVAEAAIYLYVVSTSAGVKIGITGNPSARFKSLATAMPEAMQVHFTIRGPRRIVEWAEARCHSDLEAYRIRGEWFSCSVTQAVEVARAVMEEGGVKPP